MIQRKITGTTCGLLHDGQDFVVVSETRKKYLFFSLLQQIEHVVTRENAAIGGPDEIEIWDMPDGSKQFSLWMGYEVWYSLSSGKIARIGEPDRRAGYSRYVGQPTRDLQQGFFASIDNATHLHDALHELGLTDAVDVLDSLDGTKFLVCNTMQGMRTVLHLDTKTKLRHICLAPDCSMVAVTGKNQAFVFDIT